MTQSQINYFLTVASERSITRAANRLMVSQPAISKSVAQLERELGFPLFDRRDNAISLTYAGSQLCEFFTRTKDEYRQLLRSIQLHTDRTTAQVRIGCPASWNPEMFYDQVQRYITRRYPTIDLSITALSLPDQIAMLKGKQLDLFLSLDLFDMERLGFQTQKIAESTCRLVYSKAHFKGIQSVGDFAHTDFLMYDSNVQSRFEAIVRDACQNQFTPRFRNCGNLNNAVFEAARGSGVMLLMDWDFITHSELFGFLPLDATLAVIAVYLEDNVNPYTRPIARGLADCF